MKIQRLLFILGSLIIITLLGVSIIPRMPIAKAIELDNVSPRPASVFSLDVNNNVPQQGGQQADGVSHMLKWETVARIRETSLGVYYNSPDTSSRKITLSNGSRNGEDQCNIQNVKNDQGGSTADSNQRDNPGGNWGADSNSTFQRDDAYVEVLIEGASGSSKSFTTKLKNVCSNLFKDYPLNGLVMDSSELATIGRYKLTVTVRYSPLLNVAENDNYRFQGGSLTNSFNFELSAGPNAVIGALATTDSKAYGLRSSYFEGEPPKGVLFKQPFGFDCYQNGRTNVPVRLYDADTNVFGDTYLKITKRNGTPLSASEYVRTDLDGDRIANGFYTVHGTDGWLKSTAASSTSTLRIAQAVGGEPYQLWVANPLTSTHLAPGVPFPPNGNVFSISIPNDAIYGHGEGVTCDYQLRPNISIDRSSYVYYPSINVNSNMTKTGGGPVVGEHKWDLYSVRYAAEPATRSLSDSYFNDTDPCTNGILPGGGTQCGEFGPVQTYPSTTARSQPYSAGGPDSVGTRLCFFARVKNPTNELDDDDKWAYSDMVCSISTKKPHVQFRGGDLRVAGSVRSSIFAVSGSSYGSWAEYGMFLSGVNSMAASGGALKNGTTASVDSWNQLTFSNRDSFGNPSYGYYNPLPGVSSAYAYFTGLPRSADSLNAATIPNGVYNVGASVGNTLARLPEAKGGGVVLIRDGNFTISDNIIVDNAGRTNAREITQVVIVANNIMIDEDVTRVDAWLVTPSTGSITTCPVAFSNLNAGECNQKLTVNGAIHTGKLYLRRTAGANPPGVDQLKEPAEVFNLRPDAQLWAYTYANKADYAQTDYIQELPPRY